VNNRITSGMTARLVLSDIEQSSAALARTQQRLSSGKQIAVPSDDPYGTTRALQLRSQLAGNQQYQRNVQDASSWQDATDTALSQITDMAQRARELLVQGASDTTSPEARSAIASEIDQIVDSVKSQANAQYAGHYIFGGSKTQVPPYQQGANDAYGGDSATLSREIGPNVSLDLNVDGLSAVGDGSSGLIATLRSIAADLRTPGTTSQLGGADLQNLDTALSTVTNLQAIVGARTNRLDAALSSLQQMEGATTKILSNTEDADMAQTMIDFSTQQAAYTAALKAGAQIVQPSLLDFLNTA
jgi:flagellar hook-associated protein 3 FlgL